MRKRYALVGLAVGVLSAIGVAAAAGYRVNVSRSMSLGLWQSTTDPIRVGAVVLVCPPDTKTFREARDRSYIGPGQCPGNFRTMLKPVAGLAGDVIDVTDEGTAVNGVPIPNTRMVARDSAGRPIAHTPLGRYVLRDGEVWLLAPEHPASFDSRYFGAVALSQVREVMRPVLLISDGGR